MANIGDLGEPCKCCGGSTVYLNEKHTFCKNINCPIMYTPQEWYTVITADNGMELISINEKENQNDQA